MFFNLFSKKGKDVRSDTENQDKQRDSAKKKVSTIKPTRIGHLGEYKINIQLDQLPKNCRFLSDLMLPNSKSKTGYSQIDHIVFTPYAIFIIETKNYAGTIYGDRYRAKWSVNGKISIINPFNQNYGHIQAIRSFLKAEESSFVSIVSFTRRCTFKVNVELRKVTSNDLIVYDTELSEYITRKLNVLKIQRETPIFSDEEILNLFNVIRDQNILDPKIREKHVEILSNNMVGKEDSEIEKSTAICKRCGKTVSDKVKLFCLSNKERFKGEVYCFNHQKL